MNLVPINNSESHLSVAGPLLTSAVSSVYWLLGHSGSLKCGAAMSRTHRETCQKSVLLLLDSINLSVIHVTLNIIPHFCSADVTQLDVPNLVLGLFLPERKKMNDFFKKQETICLSVSVGLF